MTTAYPWHSLDIAQSLSALSADAETGLTTSAAADRLVQYGSNELKETGGRSRWQILLDQFADVMLLMLISVAVVAAVLDVRAGEFPKDAIAIGAIVLLNAAVGRAPTRGIIPGNAGHERAHPASSLLYVRCDEEHVALFHRRNADSHVLMFFPL